MCNQIAIGASFVYLPCNEKMFMWFVHFSVRGFGFNFAIWLPGSGRFPLGQTKHTYPGVGACPGVGTFLLDKRNS